MKPLLNIFSMLQKETKIGLNVGQLISALTLLGGLIAAWISINVRVANAEIRTEQLEKGRLQNVQTIETNRIENREDHKEILRKLDIIIFDIAKLNSEK